MGDALVDITRLDDGTALVRLRGEIDMSVCDEMRDILVNTIVGAHPSKIIVEMSRVTFMDSTGLGALVAGCRSAAANDIGFAVRTPSPFVANLLRVTGLYDQLTEVPADGEPAGTRAEGEDSDADAAMER
jgi:anti-sigma B factor antagonist